MKEIVLKYLDETYKFNLSTYISYKLRDVYKKEEVSLREVFTNIQTIFGMDDDETRTIFDEWADKKSVELNNLMVSLQEKLYLKTGKTINIPIEGFNCLINEINEIGIISDDVIKNYIVL
jgi:hypothetical protein